MRKHRWLAPSLALTLLLTTAASTTYAEGSGERNNYQQDNDGQGNKGLCKWIPDWCTSRGGGDDWDPITKPGATPELDSLLLFGFGLSGLGGYAVTRYRARRRG